MLDNLLKGASGQAVHNMNLMFNLEETVGLRVKAIGFLDWTIGTNLQLDDWSYFNCKS